MFARPSVHPSSGSPCDRERRTSKDRSQGSKHRATLFAHGGEIAANDTKGRGPLLTAKGAGNLLLDLDHAQISFGLVIGKRHQQIIQESEHLLGPVEKSVQKVFRVILFGSASFLGQGVGSRRGLRNRVLSQVSGKSVPEH